MDDNIKKFPVTYRQRMKNRRGWNSIDCFVSDRYLTFRDVGDTGTEGLAVIVDVMANNYGEKPDRKLCELVLTLNDLKSMVAKLDNLQP